VVVRALANIASQASQHAAVVAAGAVPPLLALLEGGGGGWGGVVGAAGVGDSDEGTRRAAAGVIANLAMSPDCHATILAARALPTLLALAARSAGTGGTGSGGGAGGSPSSSSSSSSSTSQTRLLVAGALANLMGNPQHKESLVEAGVLGVLLGMFTERGPDAPDLQAQAARGVANYCVRHAPAGRAVADSPGGIAALLELAATASVVAARKHAGLALYHLAQCPGVAPRILEAGGLAALLQMQNCEQEAIRRLAVRCLSTLTAAGADVGGGA
jgi:hypothetical protein